MRSASVPRIGEKILFWNKFTKESIEYDIIDITWVADEDENVGSRMFAFIKIRKTK